MIDMMRVVNDIRYVGLYDPIYSAILQKFDQNVMNEEQITQALITHPAFLEEYKQLNVEYNISNIHLVTLPAHIFEAKFHETITTTNSNLQRLRELEPFTLAFEHSSTLVFIFSIEFFVLFSAQYLIVLLGLKAWQWEIYTLFGCSILLAWWYAQHQKKKYARLNQEFQKLSQETETLLKSLEENTSFVRDTYYIIEE